MPKFSNHITLFFRLALVLAVVLMTYLTLSKPTGSVHGLINDKLAHGIGFFVLAFVLDMAFPRFHLLWKLLVLAGYGLLIELLQLYTGYRHFSWWDWLADIVGLLLYLPWHKPVHHLAARLMPG